MHKWGLAVLSGLLVGFSFPAIYFGHPLPNLGFLSWVGLVPLFIVIHNASPKEAFRYGYVTALVYFLLSTYWLFYALNTHGHVPAAGSMATVLLLSLYLSLHPALALFFARLVTIGLRKVSDFASRPAKPALTGLRKVSDFASRPAKPALTWGGQQIVWISVFWTIFEWGRNYLPVGGYPWANLSMAQTAYLPLIQIADITGIYGIIFLVVWFNVFIAEIILQRQGQKITNLVSKAIITFIFVAATLGYGYFRIHTEQQKNAGAFRISVGLIQPNIPQEEKWDERSVARQKEIFREAAASLENVADLIVWPEAAWVEPVPYDTAYVPPREIGITRPRGLLPFTLMGLTFYSIQEGEETYFNSAALVDAQGNIVDTYDKVHLVPFGEYVPLGKLLSFLEPVAAVGNFKAGESARAVKIANWKAGILICFEDLFPEIARAMVRNGAHLLVNITNDAWYGFSAAAIQHASFSQLRSVETRRSMVRGTNTGLTAVIDSTGKIVVAAPLFERSILLHRIPILTGETLYTRLGDWFVLACFILAIWQIGKAYVCKRS